MYGFSVEIDLRGFEDLPDQIDAFWQNLNAQNLLGKKVEDIIFRSNETAIKTSDYVGYDEDYAKRKDRQKELGRFVGGSFDFLVATGRLEAAVIGDDLGEDDRAIERTDNKLIFNINVNYAAFMQFGAPRANIPARPFFNPSNFDIEEIEDEVTSAISDLFDLFFN